MVWNLEQLEPILVKEGDWVVTREADCLCISNEDGIEAFLAVSGQQILVETILFSKESVTDASSLNEQILKTHQFFPLSTIGIATVENDDYYIAFGALSSESNEPTIVIEIKALFDNISGFLEAYSDYIQ